MKEIDARGLSCPAPVLRTKAALENEGATEVTVVVDNAAAQQNVQRFLESKGFAVSLEQAREAYRIIGKGPAGGLAAAQAQAQVPVAARVPVAQERGQKPERSKILVFCSTDRLGFGDDGLGLKLMVNFIKTLQEMGPELWRLVFVNNGVKLCVDGSPVLSELQAYEAAGLTILVCGTCLDHFKLLERKQTGQTTNMLDIVTAMQLADKVISL